MGNGAIARPWREPTHAPLAHFAPQAEEQARWESQRQAEEAKMKRDRRVLEQQSKALLKLPNKKERSAMEGKGARTHVYAHAAGRSWDAPRWLHDRHDVSSWEGGACCCVAPSLGGAKGQTSTPCTPGWERGRPILTAAAARTPHACLLWPR